MVYTSVADAEGRWWGGMSEVFSHRSQKNIAESLLQSPVASNAAWSGQRGADNLLLCSDSRLTPALFACKGGWRGPHCLLFWNTMLTLIPKWKVCLHLCTSVYALNLVLAFSFSLLSFIDKTCCLIFLLVQNKLSHQRAWNDISSCGNQWKKNSKVPGVIGCCSACPRCELPLLPWAEVPPDKFCMLPSSDCAI